MSYTDEDDNMQNEDWDKVNEAIRYDGYGRATGLHYAPEMRCERCGEMTDRNCLVWVRIRTYDGGTSEMWCNTCEASDD